MRRTKSHSNLVISDQTCTIIIAIALCLWLAVVLIFISFNNDSNDQHTSFTYNYNPFTQILKSSSNQNNNIKNAKNIKLNTHPSPIQNDNVQVSYWESISPELTSNGWKPIYIHTQNVRMPIEEMDYLLEKYWYPNIKDLNPIIPKPSSKQKKDTTFSIDNDDNNNDIGIQDIDFSKLKKPKKKKTKKKKIEDDIVNDSGSNIKYPENWSHSCFPTKANDKDCISQSMRYWTNGALKTAGDSTAPIKDKYVTFLKDCGGFNNIRQGFEFHAMIAWLTDRTLVLPPDVPWYLIDTGHITRGVEGKSASNQVAWPHNEPRAAGVSNYDIWFDLDGMNKKISVITAPEFIKREYDNLGMDSKFYGGDIVNQDKTIGSKFASWLTDKAIEMKSILPWGQLANYLVWPDEESVKQGNSKMIDEAWIDNRKVKTYTNHLRNQPFIHFPSCKGSLLGESREGLSDYRYLGQIARSVAFQDVDGDKQFKQILRDFVHLRPEIMDYAAIVVSILGAFKYSSLHIRRNELQYKYVWCEGEKSYNDIKPLIGENEVLYIATDELEEGFFDIFKENGKRKVYQWKDFFGDDAVFEETKNVVIPGKLHGEVEMVICAMGRMFFGTKESTFSSYIGRLRGYFNAPYTQILYHHYPLTEDVDKSEDISRFSDWGKAYRGQIYKIPFKDLWEDIRDLP